MPSETGIKIFTKFAIVSTKSSIRATTRIVHLNLEKPVSHRDRTHDTFTHPTRSIKFLAAIGMIVPPSDVPADMIPNTNDLRFLNHCEVMEGIGLKIIPQQISVRMP